MKHNKKQKMEGEMKRDSLYACGYPKRGTCTGNPRPEPQRRPWDAPMVERCYVVTLSVIGPAALVAGGWGLLLLATDVMNWLMRRG